MFEPVRPTALQVHVVRCASLTGQNSSVIGVAVDSPKVSFAQPWLPAFNFLVRSTPSDEALCGAMGKQLTRKPKRAAWLQSHYENSVAQWLITHNEYLIC